MKRFIPAALVSIAGLAAFMASGAAIAQSSTEPLTRAQVINQLQQARASGELARQTDELYGAHLPTAHTSSTVTRAEVKEELKIARNSGELARQTDELYGAQLPQTESRSTVTRADVKEELREARASGELARQTDELYGSMPPEPSHSTLARAQVHQAAVQYAKHHDHSDENYPSDRPI